MKQIEKQTWRKYFEALEAVRIARERIERKEITQEEFDQIWDETELIMQDLEEV